MTVPSSDRVPVISTVDTMRPAEAYQLGWTDALAEVERALGTQHDALASRMCNTLDAILDRIDLVEPHPHLTLGEAQQPQERRAEDEALAVANGLA